MKEHENSNIGRYIPPEAKGLTIEQEEEKETIKKFLSSNSEKSKWQHFTPHFVDTKVQEYNIGELQEQINHATKVFIEGRIGQSEGEIKIKTKLELLS